VPFATNTLGRLSKLSAWWVRLAIIPEFIEPNKPQQNASHERMHRSKPKPPDRQSVSVPVHSIYRFCILPIYLPGKFIQTLNRPTPGGGLSFKGLRWDISGP
jgi:hypothetical protein